MRLFHSITHAVVTALLLGVFLVIDAFPNHGPPFFRYTGSDPAHIVWNFGWPIPWLIYDEINPPCWFTWIGSGPFLIASFFQAVIIVACLAISWMIRKKDS
ncbi:hypothetical protein [Prosthecobacter sp.]|jgi:hypothetical protein|uniref:hypothetical protein n=1 Tax=Prosthecobacter sp. TaxID=1965333 RepID=UPI0037849F4D